ncbi:MAG: M15 family metallopeptidase [Bacteroidales bacterium]|nr:M15 family metallopeptidase [Bacteroidales bacterium]
MNIKYYILLLFSTFVILFSACNNTQTEQDNKLLAQKVLNKDTFVKFDVPEPEPVFLDTLTAPFEDIDLVDVTLFTDEFILDIRYATADNFLDTILYPCAKCLLRYEVLKDLLRVQSEFKSLGYKIKLFDCYRPLSVQKIMWEKIPIVGLVANPATGSRHNRGSAIDLSLTDLEGNDIDMGTDHDDLSMKGRTFYRGFNDTIFQNRMLLRTIMQKHHFIGINSEWWHFSHDCGTKYKVSDVGFDCDSIK